MVQMMYNMDSNAHKYSALKHLASNKYLEYSSHILSELNKMLSSSLHVHNTDTGTFLPNMSDLV